MTRRVFDFADGFTAASNPTDGANYVDTAPQNISSGGTISLSSTAGSIQILVVQGSAGAQATSNTPFGTTPPSNGNIIIVRGNDNTNTVTITGNDAADGVIQNGDPVLGEGDEISYYYDSTADRYYELSRNF